MAKNKVNGEVGMMQKPCSHPTSLEYYTYLIYFLLVQANHWVVIQAERIFSGEGEEWTKGQSIFIFIIFSRKRASRTKDCLGVRTYFQQNIKVQAIHFTLIIDNKKQIMDRRRTEGPDVQ